MEAEQAIADREARKALHYFKCGKCGADMRTETFRGLPVEVCTECHAVLLDPGELQTLAGQDETDTFSRSSRCSAAAAADPRTYGVSPGRAACADRSAGPSPGAAAHGHSEADEWRAGRLRTAKSSTRSPPGARAGSR
ncbi:MAG: zf-TFIIB domain-containing protein [Myxococcota bacterium]